MSKRVGKVAFIEPEAKSICELCGANKETRPYGPGGKRVCFKCGMLDEAATLRQMRIKLLGEIPE